MKRYSLKSKPATSGPPVFDMWPDDNGDWIKLKDAQVALDAITQQRDEANAKLAKLCVEGGYELCAKCGEAVMADDMYRPATTNNGYPNCELLDEFNDDIEKFIEFLEKLQTKGYMLATAVNKDWNAGPYYVPSNASFDKLAMEHFGIDVDQLEVERLAILKEQRDANNSLPSDSSGVS